MTTQHDIETLRRHLPSLFLCCHSSMRGAVDSLANCYRLGDPLEVAGRGNPGYDAFVSIARALGIELSESSVQMSDQYRGLDWVKDRSTRSLRAWIPPVRFREGDMHVILPFYLKYHLQNLRKKDPTFPQPVIDNLYILHIWDQCFGSRSISASTQVYKDLLAWEPLGKKSYSRGLTLPYDKASSIIGTVTKLPDVCQLYLSFCQGNDCQTLTAEQSATNHPYSTQIRSRALASAPVGISYSGGVSFPRLIRMCSYEIDQVTVITRNLWTLYYLGLSKQI